MPRHAIYLEPRGETTGVRRPQQALQNTGLNMSHKACFWTLTTPGRGMLKKKKCRKPLFLVVFDDSCFVLCSGQPFWVP